MDRVAATTTSFTLGGMVVGYLVLRRLYRDRWPLRAASGQVTGGPYRGSPVLTAASAMPVFARVALLVLLAATWLDTALAWMRFDTWRSLRAHPNAALDAVAGPFGVLALLSGLTALLLGWTAVGIARHERLLFGRCLVAFAGVFATQGVEAWFTVEWQAEAWGRPDWSALYSGPAGVVLSIHGLAMVLLVVLRVMLVRWAR